MKNIATGIALQLNGGNTVAKGLARFEAEAQDPIQDVSQILKEVVSPNIAFMKTCA